MRSTTNKIMLCGRLGQDPKKAETQNVCNFSIAVDESYQHKATGEIIKSIQWMNVKAWNKKGETVQKHLKKGCLIQLTGRLTIETYEKEGQKHKTPVIELHEFHIIQPFSK